MTGPLLWIVVIWTVLAAGACSGRTERRVVKRAGLNVLLITIDTLRADRLGVSGHAVKTPHLDALARGGARFLNAVCEVPLTLPSHTSIMTGTSPAFHQVRNNGTYRVRESDTTLAEVLKQQGYETAAFIGAFPLDSRFGLDQGFDLYDDRLRNPDHLAGYEPQRTAEQVFRAAAAWLEPNAGTKFFAWVHYYDPHLPYSPPPPFDGSYASPYDGEVAYTDGYVGKLREILEERGVADRTLIVVAGDHGEGLGDHGEDTHGIFLYDSTLKVPVIFHAPGAVPGGIEVTDLAGTIDIMPTILDLLDIPVPRSCQGTSLVPAIDGSPAGRESYAETYLPLLACGWSELKSIRTGRWKFVLAPEPELYDLAADPREERNIIDREPETAARMLRRLRESETSFAAAGSEPARTGLAPDDLEKLASLGYIGAGPQGPKVPGRPAADPKDKIHIFEDMVRAELALSSGRPGAAGEILRRILSEDPENPWLLHFLGRAYRKMGNLDQAIRAFDRAVELNPDDMFSRYLLARSSFERGLTRQAKDEAARVLSRFGDHLGTLLLLAEIHAGAGDFDTAFAYLERAVRLDPEDPTVRLLFAQTLALAKDYERALAEYGSLLPRMSEDPAIHHQLGLLSALTGRSEAAIGHFLKELEIREDPETRFLLGMTYGKLARYPEAIACLERYLASLPPSAAEKRQKAEAALRVFRSKLP